jgi:mannose-6-phosphate isomerase-like protein (cupin superfamily)
VTGGTVVGERKTNDPSEPRGKSLTGGQSYHLTKGDILVIPHGVPHWFQQVDGTFTNYTVKVRTGK